MNDEQKYKEALERAKEYKKHGYMMINSALDNIFPELKESEDERIRKELIEAIKGLWDTDALPMPLTLKRKDEWLAWLEKQEEKDKLIKELNEYKVKYMQKVLEKHINSMSNKEDERIRTFLHHTFTVQYLCKDKLGKWHGEPVVNILAWLEKQSKKPKD